MTAIAPSLPARASALDLLAAQLRASPAYELVLFDRLSNFERQALSALAEDPDCYGVLRPRINSGLSLKAVSRDVALLLFSLQKKGPLPRYAIRTLGDNLAATIGSMILDGILEIESNGEMISGPEAGELMFVKPINPASQGRLAAVSRRALEYAAALSLEDPLELSARLYSYNGVPASRRWRQLLPEDDATAKYLGLVDGSAARLLLSSWRSLPESPAWISWRARGADSEEELRPAPAITYKLYVSPACDQLREAVHAIAQSVVRSEAMQWKVGKGVQGMLRPDKMVIYFSQFTALQEVALEIMKHLEGCRPHGVPFTAELAGQGLLSWGIDPPRETNGLSWLGGDSWRGRLCNRLAAAIVQAAAGRNNSLAEVAARPIPDASTQNLSTQAASFALQRLRLDGIDPQTWTPLHGFAWAS